MAIMLDGVSYGSLYEVFDAGFIAGFMSSMRSADTRIENGSCEMCGYRCCNWFSMDFCPGCGRKIRDVD